MNYKRLALFVISIFLFINSYAAVVSNRCIVEITARVISVKERHEQVMQFDGSFGDVTYLDMMIQIKKIGSVIKEAYSLDIDCQKVYKVGKTITVSVEMSPTFLMDSNGSIVRGCLISGNLDSIVDDENPTYNLTKIQLL
ncbi:MAG: hypothetical protein NTZ63_03500 [Candidatus Omnitrophica bacterium]|nr:hypothetical protein [Candidatus Omnitrophota bacterium]